MSLNNGGFRKIETPSEQEAVDQFVLAVAKVAEEAGDFFVVVGTNAPAEFVERLQEFCPVVRDEVIGDLASIVVGTPDEWESLREVVMAEVRKATGG